MASLSIVLSIVIGALIIAHYFFKHFNFFKRHGVIHVPSVPIVGAMASVIFRQTSFVEFTRRIYNFNQDAKYIGSYATTRPILLLRDPELIKSVLVKNCDAFYDRPVFADFNENIITQNLFNSRKEKWRNVRHLLSPFFASSKMRIMFTLMSEHAANFANFMSTLPVDKSNVNVKDVFDRYTNDIIASCFYGIKIDSMRDPKNKFYICGKNITNMSVIRTIKYIFVRTFPTLGRILNIKLLDNHAIKYFQTTIKNVIANRRDAEQIIRSSDIIQSMINNNERKDRLQLDTDDMIAQAYVFYFGGFETSSSVMSFIAHKIMAHPNIQIKSRQEIDKILDESNGNVSYEVINQSEYLNAVVKEALRLFSPSILERVCNRAFELPPALPGKKPFTVEEGMIIWIPLNAIHHDEKYYYDPEEFRPERFLNNDHNTLFYCPFGLGPKMCIGSRFATLITKVVLFHLLARCELKHCARTKSVSFSKKHLIMMPEDGYWINVQRRDDMHPTLKITT